MKKKRSQGVIKLSSGGRRRSVPGKAAPLREPGILRQKGLEFLASKGLASPSKMLYGLLDHLEQDFTPLVLSTSDRVRLLTTLYDLTHREGPKGQVLGVDAVARLVLRSVGMSFSERTLRWFPDSPDAGDPACVCSYCDCLIREGEYHPRLFKSEPGAACKLEARFHADCLKICLDTHIFTIDSEGGIHDEA